MRIRFYLRGREAPIEIEAESLTTTRSLTSAELTGYKLEGIEGAKPQWISLTDVVFITTLDESDAK